MKKYILIFVALLALAPALSYADILGQSPNISGAGITATSSAFWNTGAPVSGYYFNIGQPSENATDSYLAINSYNPDNTCFWSGNIIDYYSGPFYTSSTLVGSFGIGAVYNADGSTTFGDPRQPGNSTTSIIALRIGQVTSTYYYQIHPTCYYSVSATNYLNVSSHPSFLTYNQTTSLQFVWASSLDESLGIQPPENSCDVPYNVTVSPQGNITNDFSNWQVNTDPLLEGCSYKISVSYSPQIGSLTTASDFTIATINPDTLNNTIFSIAKSKNLWNYYDATTTQINVAVQVQDTLNGYVDGFNTGALYLSFASSTINAPPGFDSTQQCGGICSGFGTIGGGSISTPTSTIATTGNACTPPADFTDIGGGIAYGFCTTLNYLFVPNAGTNGIIGGDMTILETVPPFSWFFAENAALAGVAAGPGGSATYFIGGNTSSTSFTPDNGVSFVIYPGINGATSSMTLLPADLTSNGFLADGRLVDDYYNLILTFIICIAIIMVYKIVL